MTQNFVVKCNIGRKGGREGGRERERERDRVIVIVWIVEDILRPLQLKVHFNMLFESQHCML